MTTDSKVRLSEFQYLVWLAGTTICKEHTVFILREDVGALYWTTSPHSDPQCHEKSEILYMIPECSHSNSKF
jgi:hypothetical protein